MDKTSRHTILQVLELNEHSETFTGPWILPFAYPITDSYSRFSDTNVVYTQFISMISTYLKISFV